MKVIKYEKNSATQIKALQDIVKSIDHFMTYKYLSALKVQIATFICFVVANVQCSN